ncbi:hypothetical protein QTP70_004610 [Hemibagrus guttatus]|uniref:ribonuclease H n=1 Tax=Hemibagrus guttatus TaxID=175788 RepID=A0AAE0VDQ6_9TELE|nr:hypothetical protein QTP70_004610 [Hemibagrus guttatus]
MDQLSEEVRQESPWTMMFADDIVICSESREQAEENLERWRFALERRGMKVSRSKTEYMCVNEREGSGTIKLQGGEVKKVQEFKYLGSTVQSNGECGKEVKERMQAESIFLSGLVLEMSSCLAFNVTLGTTLRSDSHAHLAEETNADVNARMHKQCPEMLLSMCSVCQGFGISTPPTKTRQSRRVDTLSADCKFLTERSSSTPVSVAGQDVAMHHGSLI